MENKSLHCGFWRFGLIFSYLCLVQGCAPQKKSLVKPPDTTVKVAHPLAKKVIDFDEFTGRTEAIGLVEVRSRVGGYLNQVAFIEGQEVKKGDLLFEIDPRPFQAKVDQAEAKLKSDEAKLREFTAEYNRNKLLHDRRALSLEELQQSEAKRDVAAAEIIGDNAEITQARLDLEFSKVVSPVDGRIGRAEIREGNLISAQTTGSPVLTTIVPQSPIYAYFDVDERTLIERLKLIRNQPVPPDHIKDSNIKVMMGLSDGNGFPYEGMIDFIDNKVESSTGTIRIRAMFNNDKRLLTPGMFARLRIPDTEPHDAILIPEIAILTDQGLKYVWVVTSEGKVERHNIRLGKSNDSWRQIIQGITSEDQIIVQGIQKVREGAKVLVEPVVLDEKGDLVEQSAKPAKQALASPTVQPAAADSKPKNVSEPTKPAASAN